MGELVSPPVPGAQVPGLRVSPLAPDEVVARLRALPLEQASTAEGPPAVLQDMTSAEAAALASLLVPEEVPVPALLPVEGGPPAQVAVAPLELAGVPVSERVAIPAAGVVPEPAQDAIRESGGQAMASARELVEPPEQARASARESGEPPGLARALLPAAAELPVLAGSLESGLAPLAPLCSLVARIAGAAAWFREPSAALLEPADSPDGQIAGAQAGSLEPCFQSPPVHSAAVLEPDYPEDVEVERLVRRRPGAAPPARGTASEVDALAPRPAGVRDSQKQIARGSQRRREYAAFAPLPEEFVDPAIPPAQPG